MTTSAVAIGELLERMVHAGASDLHVGTTLTPRLRIEGQLVTLDLPALDRAALDAWLGTILDATQRAVYAQRGDVDFGIDGIDNERFRVSLYRERGHDTLAVRRLASRIPSMDELGLPPTPQAWTHLEQGLILVTGPTGCGKSTTIASMVQDINARKAVHIVTIEDPIEYLLPSGMATVQQREIGSDVDSFPRAVRAALREDVDVLVVGEMRDPETMAAALAVAETGHLVFATLHTNSAEQAIDRIIDAFRDEEQPLIRSRLSATLVGVIYQRLLLPATGKRLAAFEVLAANSAVRNLIREGKTFQIPNTMVTGTGYGMQTMAAALASLAEAGSLTSRDVDEFLRSNPL